MAVKGTKERTETFREVISLAADGGSSRRMRSTASVESNCPRKQNGTSTRPNICT